MPTGLNALTGRLRNHQLTSPSSATGLTVPVRDMNGLNSRPTLAIITPETQAVRWRDDDVSPTASVGMPLAAGVTLQYDGDLTKIKFIEQTAGAKLNISYYI